MSGIKILLFLIGMAHLNAGSTPVEPTNVEKPPVRQTGVASWYGAGNWHGDITANGEDFDPYDYTCAHRDLPFNTMILVEDQKTGNQVWCRVNDRGPYGIIEHKGELTVQMNRPKGERWRVLDLSAGAAKELGVLDDGLTRVKLRYWRRTPDEDLKVASRTRNTNHPFYRLIQ